MDETHRRRLRRDETEKTIAEMKALAQRIADPWTSEETAVALVKVQKAEDVPTC